MGYVFSMRLVFSQFPVQVFKDVSFAYIGTCSLSYEMLIDSAQKILFKESSPKRTSRLAQTKALPKLWVKITTFECVCLKNVKYL